MLKQARTVLSDTVLYILNPYEFAASYMNMDCKLLHSIFEIFLIPATV
jgi:hypothetical protein